MSTFGKIGAKNLLFKPPYDAEVEYLESNGTKSWFNLKNTKLNTFSKSASDSITCTIIGWLKQTYGWNILMAAYMYNPGGYLFSIAEYPEVKYWYGNVRNSNLLGSLKTYTFQYGSTGNGSKTLVDSSVVMESSSVISFSTGIHPTYQGAGIFSLSGSSFLGKNKGAFYNMNVFKNGIKVIDIVPVRVNQDGFLYDRANPTSGPYGNGLIPSSGEQSFILGPDKTRGGGKCIELSESAFYAYSSDSFWKEAA